MTDQPSDAWTFIIQNGRMGLKIHDKWADDDELIAFSQTPEGATEIERQWAEYDRRGCPFMSYQAVTIIGVQNV
jgi:hypothetical protein